MRCTSRIGRHRRESGFSLIEMVVTVAILAVLLGVVGQTVFRVQQSYLRTRTAVEAQNNARSALDLITRLVRQAGNNPRNNPLVPLIVQDNIAPVGQIDTIRIRSDWNPPDGSLTGAYEDVTFSLNTAAGQLMIREGAAALTVPFVENINGFEILCFDADGVLIPPGTATTVAGADTIVSVDIVLTTNVPQGPPVVFRSSATVRGRE